MPSRYEHILSELYASPPAVAPVVDAACPVVLYGAGQLGRMALDFLRANGVCVKAVLDKDAQAGQELDGVPVFTPNNYAPESGTPLLVAIVTFPYMPIQETLRRQGWETVLPFYDYAEAFSHVHPLNNGWFAGELDEEDKARIPGMERLWADDRSKACYAQFVAWRYARREIACDEAEVTPQERFFIPEITRALTAEEVFIDAGAYDGWVTQAFIAHVQGEFHAVHAFEPDRENFARLQQSLQRENIHLHPQALAERVGTVAFAQGAGMAARCFAAAADMAEAVPLDALGLAPSFLKLHLEGGELAALRGARRTLTTHRPLLALTVYHNRDGLWKTAQWMQAHLPDYHFYFRLHAWCGTGAVIYAIPQERHAI